MKHILLTISLILFANTVAATSLTIKHNKKLPTPYELITKGTILDKYGSEEGSSLTLIYWIAWDKTDDIYHCYVEQQTTCLQTEQQTLTLEDMKN